MIIPVFVKATNGTRGFFFFSANVIIYVGAIEKGGQLDSNKGKYT